MQRPWQIWLAFAACLALLVAAVGWLSRQALEADRAETAAQQQALVEENASLALWRMESALAPLIWQINAAFSGEVVNFPRASGNLTRPDQDIQELAQAAASQRAAVAILSQRIVLPPETLVRAYFQVDADDRWSWYGHKGDPSLASAIDFQKLISHLDQHNGRPPIFIAEQPAAPANASQPGFAQGNRGQSEFDARQRNSQSIRSQSEFDARQRFANNRANNNSLNGILAEPMPQDAMLRPLWIGDTLLLARRVALPPSRASMVQGCQLDWQAIRPLLLADIADLFPRAELLPADDDHAQGEGRMLASLPVRLRPGEVETPAAGWSPIRLALLLVWGTLLLAALAVAWVLHATLALGERRAAFVSAVTHELRTPLTTFRMYAEMLSEGMVADERQQQSYLQTLRVEAERLTHLVANVLAYARLERGALSGRVERTTVDRLLEVSLPRLSERATQAGFAWNVAVDEPLRQQAVLADPAAVEQILFNLVDNACKYASSPERHLELGVRRQPGRLQITLADRGPGVAPDIERRLFRAFHKSAQAAAQSAPGVGLGLALSRRLAREMNGDLAYEPSGQGATFVLTLPLA